MMSIISSVLTMLGPLIMWGAKTFIKEQDRLQQFIKSYYSFLDKVDESVRKKVDNHIKLKQARREKQQQLLNEKRKRDEEKRNAEKNKG